MAAAWGHEPGDAARLGRRRCGSSWPPSRARASADDHLVGVDTDAVRAELRGLAALDDVGAQVRIHGDLHLAQVIRVGAGWRVLDFEGEPARGATTGSPGPRRCETWPASCGPSTTRRRIGLVEWGDADDELDRRWLARGRPATGPRSSPGTSPCPRLGALLPAGAEARTQVLRAFELDKAVYELALRAEPTDPSWPRSPPPASPASSAVGAVP